MKFSLLIITYLVLLNILSCYGGPDTQLVKGDENTEDSKLKQDIQQLLNLIPQKKIEKLSIEYFIFDKEFRKFVKYVRSTDFKDFWNELLSQPMTRDFVDYAHANGVNVIAKINEIAELLGLPRYPGSFKDKPNLTITKISAPNTRGLNGFFSEVEQLLPKEALRALFVQKCDENPTFKNWFEILDFDQIQKIMESSKAALKVKQSFEEYGVDVNYYLELIRKGLAVPN